MTPRTSSACPQCGKLVSRSQPHVCHAHPVVPWPSADVPPSPPARSRADEPVSDPQTIREHLAACRAALAATKPPQAAPAALTSLYRDRPYA